MEIDDLSAEQRELWRRVGALWKLTTTQDAERIGAVIHPDYSGWVTGQALPHGRDAAIASAGPSSPRVLGYDLKPLGITVFDGIVGIVHYSYVADVRSGTETPRHIAGRWTEIYLRKDGEWLMISVSGGPDGER